MVPVPVVDWCLGVLHASNAGRRRWSWRYVVWQEQGAHVG
ncbi:MAG: hypothetical protein ABUK13_10430 [Gammaproteobacteria bacterium]